MSNNLCLRLSGSMVVPAVGFLLLLASVASGQNNEAKAEVSLKFNIGAPGVEKWHDLSNIGGILAFDYNFFQYFSLGGEVGIRSVAFGFYSAPETWKFGHVLDLSIGVVPRLRVPIELGSTLLVPYLAAPLGMLPLTLHESKISVGMYGGLALGAKYFIMPNFGISLDYNPSFEFRNARNMVPITGSILSGNLGIIYAF